MVNKSRTPRAVLIGPCPRCRQNSITLYSDGRVECEGITKRAFFEKPRFVYEFRPGLGEPGNLTAIITEKCTYRGTAKQCVYDMAHPFYRS